MSNTFIFDLSNYRNAFSDSVPAGEYSFIVDHVEHTKSKAGTPMLRVWLKVIKGAYSGCTLVEYMVLSGPGAFRMRSFMQALGFDISNRVHNLTTDMFLNRPIGGEVAIETSKTEEGKEVSNSRIKEFIPASSVGSSDGEAKAPLATDFPGATTTDAAAADAAAQPTAGTAPSPDQSVSQAPPISQATAEVGAAVLEPQNAPSSVVAGGATSEAAPTSQTAPGIIDLDSINIS